MLTENLPSLKSSLPGLSHLLGAAYLRQGWALFVDYPHRRDQGYGWAIEPADQTTKGPQFLWPNWSALRDADWPTRALFYINAERIRSIYHKSDLSSALANWQSEDLQKLVETVATTPSQVGSHTTYRLRLFRVQSLRQPLPHPPWPDFQSGRGPDEPRFNLIREWEWPGGSP